MSTIQRPMDQISRRTVELNRSSDSDMRIHMNHWNKMYDIQVDSCIYGKQSQQSTLVRKRQSFQHSVLEILDIHMKKICIFSGTAFHIYNLTKEFQNHKKRRKYRYKHIYLGVGKDLLNKRENMNHIKKNSNNLYFNFEP